MHDSAINTRYLWLISLVAALGGFLFGYDWVVIGGAKPFYEAYFAISNPTVSGWVMSSALLGCILGALLSASIADQYGRKWPLVLAASLFVISALGSAIADSLSVFVIYRIIGGVGIGLASTISPMYISEVSPARSRGKMVALNQLTIVLGILAAQIINLLIAEPTLPEANAETILASWNGQSGWRYMFAAELLPAVLFMLFALVIPESPRWLCKTQQQGKAKIVLQKMGTDEYASNTLDEIRKSMQNEVKGTPLNQAFSPGLRPVLTTGIILAAFQQWCGINVVFNYAQEVFAAAGFDIDSTLKSIVATGLTNLIFTIMALPLVDKIGRRRLMLSGAFGLAAVYSLLALSYAAGLSGLPVLLMVLSGIAIYATTLAPVTWVLLSEIFPNYVRGIAMSVSTFSLWIASFLLTLTFPVINASLGASGSFAIYAVVCLLGFGFILRKVPETKGLSLEKVEALLAPKADIDSFRQN